MTVKEILTPVIQHELEKYESQGYKIRLKTATNNRIKYTVLCALGAIAFFPIALIVYVILMKKTNTIDTILSIAKKYPDTPIETLVALEIKK